MATVTPTLAMMHQFIASLGYDPNNVEQVIATPTTFTVWYRVVSTTDPTKYTLQSDGYFLQ